MLKKYPVNIILLGLLSLGLFFASIILFGSNIQQLSILIISFSLFGIVIIKATIYFYNKKLLLESIKTEDSALLREKKRAEILLDVGRLCSWHYSTKAGILKLDSSEFKLMGAANNYYIYEELIRNRHLKRLIHFMEDTCKTEFDEEAYFPVLNKWLIIRGRCIDTHNEDKPNQFVGILLDNTERRLSLKKIENISVTDELTGLKNRRYFFESLGRELNLYKRSKNIFSVAMIDLDFFKKINDKYGHLAGDFVLKEFSEIVTREVRPYDIVSRFGGEEFIILFPGIKKDEAKHIMDRVQDKIEQSDYSFNGQEITFTFSCGIGDVTEIGVYTEKEFITIIDTRLYKAKDLGRNLIVSGG